MLFQRGKDIGPILQLNALSYTLDHLGIEEVKFSFEKAVASTITISFTIYYKNGQSLGRNFSISKGNSTGSYYPEAAIESQMDYIEINELNPNRDDTYQYTY